MISLVGGGVYERGAGGLKFALSGYQIKTGASN